MRHAVASTTNPRIGPRRERGVTVDENVAMLRRLVEAINQNELARVASEVIAPGFVRHDLAGAWPGVR